MGDRARKLLFVLTCFHLLIPLALVVQHGGDTEESAYAQRSDAALFRNLANEPGKPYVDYEAAYPPVTVAVFKALGPKTFQSFIVRLIVLQAICDWIIAFALFRTWGSRALIAYLALAAPLLAHMLTKFDLVAVAFAAVGFALAKRVLPRTGGALVAVGAFVKVWPAVLVPAFAARRQWKAAIASAVTLVVGGAVWIAYGGIDGIAQVVTYRGARGWHTDSVPGSLLYLVQRETPIFEQGTWRTGTPASILGSLLTIGLVVTVLYACLVVYRRGGATDGLLEVTVVAAMLVWATLCSVQFVSWLLPFAAVAAARGARRVGYATGVVVVLTMLGQMFTNPERARPSVLVELTFLARNGALVALLVVGLLALRRSPQVISSMRSSATRAHSDVTGSTTI